MLALIYLILMVALGDSVCRRFYSFVSLPHRIAAAFLSGLLISTWLTYLAALLFMRTAQPLLWGNLLFFAAAFGFIFWSSRHASAEEQTLRQTDSPPETRAERADWIIIGLFLVFAGWQMFSTFNMADGKVQIANHQWSDFGSTVTIMQTFALGHNFPTEYPHFSGERIRYHFLFYFQAGNLEYLGLNPALSNNVLSILSLVSMLILVMTLGVVLFRSRAVGRIGAGLFFFHGSLSFIPFFMSHESIGDALNAAYTARDFLPSGFDYRGELWGIWSQVVFLNQRHFATSIGLLLLILVFLTTRFRAALPLDEAAVAPENNRTSKKSKAKNAKLKEAKSDSLRDALKIAAPFIFSGALLGLLPMFNSAVFAAAFAVLAFLFVLFPLKKQMLWLAAATALFALPQVIFLKTGTMREAGYSLLYWGYTVENPTLLNVVYYLGFTFGFKWLLIALALYLATQFERRVMIAVSSLIAVAFCFQFSDEVLANHKFLNLWLIVANLFVAYGLWRLWNATWLKSPLPGKIAAAALVALITIGGIIDLFPIRNGFWMEMAFEDDPLVRWVKEETDPKAIFLSPKFVNHRIMLAGRRVFYGHPYYAWSAGYPTAERDIVYKRIFEEQNPQRLLGLLQANNISYVAIDDLIRNGGAINNLNEQVFKDNFERVFHDPENRYDRLAIFKVPVSLSDVSASVLQKTKEDDAAAKAPPLGNALRGSQGQGNGQFDKPRGIAADAAGNLYVADSGNSRIQKFSPEGNFLEIFGKSAAGESGLREPSGIAVDSTGGVYVADALNHRLLKFNADGRFETHSSGAAPRFYGPRDVAVGANKKVYVLDQGRSRVVRLDPESENFAEWGQKGAGESEFNDPTGIAVGGDRVFVTDAGNDRIQIFDLDGKFIRQWKVPEWDKYLWHYPDAAFDERTERLYVTSGRTNEVLVFDADGNRLDSLKPAEQSAKLDNPSSLVLVDARGGKRLYVLNTDGARVSVFELRED